jgi:antitoxin VapB
MPSIAKVFRSGNSQAVRLPKEVRFGDGVRELSVRREGDGLVLEPIRPKQFSRKFWSTLGTLPDFERPQQSRQRRAKIFP